MVRPGAARSAAPLISNKANSATESEHPCPKHPQAPSLRAGDDEEAVAACVSAWAGRRPIANGAQDGGSDGERPRRTYDAMKVNVCRLAVWKYLVGGWQIVVRQEPSSRDWCSGLPWGA